MGRRIVLLLALVGLAAHPAVWAARANTRAWPKDQALPHFAAAQHLDVADVSSLSGDQQLLFNTLEGIVNRTQPRIYLLWNADEGRRTWLATLHTEFGIPVSEVANPWSLLARYRSSISGVVVYDPAVPDSINVATSLAGVDNTVVASPTLAARLEGAPYGLPVVEDLRGRFASRLDAYRWEYQHLWVPNVVTHRMLVGLPPLQSPSVHLADVGAINVPLEPVYDTGVLGVNPFASLRDYSVAARALVVWLDHNEPAERLLLEQILSGMPPDSPYLGTHAGDVAGEITIVALLSSHSVYEVAADYFNNGSVFGGIRPPLAPVPSAPAAPRLEKNKIYVTFTMSDGDNIQYDQRRLRKIWDNPARGRVPINWTISPLLVDAAPAILDYYRRSATANDLFMAGPSGAGYSYPSSWPGDTFPSFTRQTGRYSRQTSMTTVDILNAPDGVRLPLSNAAARDYVRDVGPKGMMLNYNFFHECHTDNVIVDGTPITTGCIVSSSSNAQGEAEFDIFQQAQRCPPGPCFISIEFTAWNVTPADVAAVKASLATNPRYEVVRADQYFDLLRHTTEAT